MSTETDAPSEDDRPVAALAGPFLHQRAAFRSPRPGGRIDELDAAHTAGDDTPPDPEKEDDAG